jgi:hypothetical protein
MKLYQIYYNEISKSHLNHNFIPYNNTNPEKPNEFEYGVMRSLYQNPNTWNKNKYLGVLSWKFQQKTNLHPDKMSQWLKKNKGKDVYTFNPFTNMNTFYNVWQQAECFHPGIITFVTQLFKQAGLNTELLSINNNNKITCYCNYWIANKNFWNVYMLYTERLYQAIYNADDETKNRLFYIKADQNINSGLFSFIFERMFSTVLAQHQNEFKILPYFT